MLGVDAEELLDYHRLHGDHPVLAGARTQVVVRSRFAERHVTAGARRGVDQYVILGAGLDSFAYRQRRADVVVFEVDHPVTQEWKRARVSQAGLTQHRPVTYVPVDFEAGHSLPERLQANGFDAARPAVLSWLGVTVYLSRPAIEATLKTIGGFAPGTELIVDFMLPAECRDEAGEFYASQVAPNAAAGGEPWLSFFTPAEIGELLRPLGFSEPTTSTQRAAIDDGLWRRQDALRPAELSVLTHAVVGRPVTPSDQIGPADSSG